MFAYFTQHGLVKTNSRNVWAAFPASRGATEFPFAWAKKGVHTAQNPQKVLPWGNTFGTPHFHKPLFIINWLYSGTIVVYFIGKYYMKRLPMKPENHQSHHINNHQTWPNPHRKVIALLFEKQITINNKHCYLD